MSASAEAEDVPPRVATKRPLAGEPAPTLHALFLSLPPAQAAGLPRRTRGRVLAIEGTGGLPGFLRRALIALVNGPFGLWRGKSFDGARGANRFGLPGLTVALGHYRVLDSETHDGMGPATVLDYDVAENLSALRRIRGELRRLGPGRWLGRMRFRGTTAERTLLYFELEEIV